MTMKAILVAGGHGSRLSPFTQYTQKTLLPLHNRPVIDYALGTIRRAGIKDITIISNKFVGQMADHVGQGLPGERIHYVIEEEPKGVGVVFFPGDEEASRWLFGGHKRLHMRFEFNRRDVVGEVHHQPRLFVVRSSQ